MTLNLATEEAIRALDNPFINRALDLWAEETTRRLGRPLEVVLGNRRKHPALGAYKGLNTQVTLSSLESRNYLAIWYDPYDLKYNELVAQMGRTDELLETLGPMLESGLDLGPDYEPSLHLEKLDWDMLLRRILFWVLRARGFIKMANKDSRFQELESIVNLECWTPALNGLLREMDYNIAPSVKELAEDTVSGMSGMEEPTRRADRALNALRIWNLLKVCDPIDAGPLVELLDARFPRIRNLVDEVDEMAGSHKLDDPVAVAAFTGEFIRRYHLPGEWERADEFSGFLKSFR